MSAVSCVGTPSKNLRVPRRVSTRIGVIIDEGIGVLYPSGILDFWSSCTPWVNPIWTHDRHFIIMLFSSHRREHMKSIFTPCRTIVAAVLVVLLIAGLPRAFASKQTDPFPTFPSQRSNVAFWKKVYSVYSTSQGILHDRRDLDIIYEVVPLKDPLSAGAARHNDEKVKQAKGKYDQLLRSLAAGKTPASAEERRVHALFADQGSRKLLKDASLNVRLQLGQKDRFRKGVIRSGAYLGEIKQIFKKQGLPEDLAYLPHVESSFDYQAYSKFGAAGIWQFTHATGKKFMTIDYTVDERRDPIRATHAAAKLLKENYGLLGNWPMAITAYNHGPGGMLRAQKAHGDYESVFNRYTGASFGFASRNFYSEFLAAREIAKNYTRHFGNLELAKPFRSHTLTIPGYISHLELARQFQVDEKTLRQYNPSLREPVFKGQKYVPKGFLLHLPERPASGPAYLAQIPAEIIKGGQKPSRFYRVKKGDTVSQVARNHGVNPKDLILANGLNSRATIYAGQNLRIPAQGEKIMVATASGSRPAPVAKPAHTPQKEAPKAESVAQSPPATTSLPAGKPRPAPAAKPAPVPNPTQVAALEPVVKAEQPDLKLPEESLKPLEMALQVNPAVVVGNLSVEKVSVRNAESFGVIQVEPEETLGHYADWLQIPTQKIRSLNRLSFNKPIHVGQKVEIPFGKVTREQFEEKRYEYHKEIEEDFFAAYAVDRLMTYRIEQGDNIWTLCQKRFELPFWLLRKYNPEMDSRRLVLSQPLIIPMVSRIGERSGPTVPEENGEKPGKQNNGSAKDSAT